MDGTGTADGWRQVASRTRTSVVDSIELPLVLAVHWQILASGSLIAGVGTARPLDTANYDNQ